MACRARMCHHSALHRQPCPASFPVPVGPTSGGLRVQMYRHAALHTDNHVYPHFLSRSVPLPGALGSGCTVTQLYTHNHVHLTSCPGRFHFRET